MTTSESIPHGELNILFTKSVPHVLEKIFFSLDFDSFVACGKVSFAFFLEVVSAEGIRAMEREGGK